jgi:sRNA-binding protein
MQGIMTKRNIVRLDLDGQIAGRLDRVTEEFGMTQVTLMSRLVEWFARQDLRTQTEIVMRRPAESNVETLRRMLRQMADHP